MAKTVEELEAELLELKNGNDALASKNKELLDEMKTERRKNSDNSGDLQKYYELQDKYDALKDEKTKLEHELGKSNKQLEKSTAEIETLSTNINKIVGQDGLTRELAKAGVKPEFMDATMALLGSKVSVVDNMAMIGDKNVAEFMQEWATTDGKAFITAPDNQGGGSGGGNGGGNDMAKIFDKTDPSFNLTKQAELFKSDPALYEQLSKG